ncbi:MAG: glycosyltransferase family 4 protein [Gammaproteobacteria bacterium]|nr:glycosyltransferase family 4 protein [Gammaproteobacteria bacterium]
MKTNRPIRVLCIAGESDRAEAESFIQMHRMGIDITVMIWPGIASYEALIAAGVPTIPHVLKWKLSPPCIRFIRAELKHRKYDVLHMLDKRATMNGLMASIGMNVKLIAYRGYIGNVTYWSPQSWLYLLNPRLDRIICVCEAVRQYLLGLGMPGIRLRRDVPVTIHKGHDADLYSGPPVDLKQFGIPDDTFVVACVSRPRWRKGIPVLLEAIDRLPPGLDIHFLLAGPKMDNPRYKRLVAANSYAKRIHLFGFLTGVPWILKACDVTVLPTFREALSRVVIEGMIGGAVPIVTNVGGCPELVLDGQSGFVVPPRQPQPITDRILKLYNDRALHARMSDAARERIRTHFTVQETARKTIQVYRQLLSASNDSGSSYNASNNFN